MTDIVAQLESEVRCYSRAFPAVFHRATGPFVYDTAGRRYIDFLAGAGALNYGHNNPFIRQRLLDYLAGDGVTHLLDMHTEAKRSFLDAIRHYVLAPGKLNYKIQYCGPTGTNAVEAALKLARKVTGRTGVFAFAGGYHGVTAGSLSVTADAHRREASGLPPAQVAFFPYPGGPYLRSDSLEYLSAVLRDPMSGVGRPAAVIVEPVQAEGGVYVAPPEWLRQLWNLCRDHEALLICDEIQTGCGRTGPFFAFQRAGIEPDLVTVSKSISGFGLPFSLLLIRPELDRWAPGEHNGTFRANPLAMVTGAAALEYRAESRLDEEVARLEAWVGSFLRTRCEDIYRHIDVRGVGLIWGVDLSRCGGEPVAREVGRRCFARGLIIERVGRHDAVMKVLPPLTIPASVLEEGCTILVETIADVLEDARFGTCPQLSMATGDVMAPMVNG